MLKEGFLFTFISAFMALFPVANPVGAGFLLPVNCITALLGVPVILWVIAKNLRRFK